jgi:integrase
MATVRKRGNILHIQWYDPFEDKITSKTTGLTATEFNKKIAKKYSKELQYELSKRNRELKQIGIQKISIRDTFNQFLRNNQGKSSKTIKDYERFFNKFTEYFDPNEPSTTITKIRVEDWLNQLKQTTYAKNTIHGYGKQCNHFLNFLFDSSYTQFFRINKEVRTKPEVKEKIVFQSKDIVKIFNGLKIKTENFQLLINILFYTGLRSSDILTITSEKINLRERSFIYYSPKRKKHREVAYHKDLSTFFSKIKKEKKTGKILNYSSVESMGRAIKRYMKHLGISSNGYTARTFRKTFITLARSKYNMDASIVKELVGHEHGNTTDKYYNQISIATMRNELKKFKRPLK